MATGALWLVGRGRPPTGGASRWFNLPGCDKTVTNDENAA
jgi:hypothetical protein